MAPVVVDGPAYGSIAMTSYTLGTTCPEPTSQVPANAPSVGRAPDQTNI